MNIKKIYKKIIDKSTNVLIRNIFNKATKKIFDVPIIGQCSSTSNVVLLTMLQESDVQMYLLAVKSLMQYLIVNKVVIVCDPSLSLRSRDIIKKHITSVEFLEAIDYRCSSLPVGGTWERLYAISHLTKDFYVVQMDADILFMKTPKEVIDAISNNTSFILGTNPLFQQISIDKMTEVVLNWMEKYQNDGVKPHIQIISELNMKRLVEPLGYTLYTRGCSGFAGFSKGSLSVRSLEKLSSVFYNDLGDQWEKWGTEQFMSNLMLSNVTGIQVLPTDKYNSSDIYNDKFIMAHFIGTERFYNFLYMKLAKRFIFNLKSISK